jgi:hypothetical protein
MDGDGFAVMQLYKRGECETLAFPEIGVFQCTPERIDAWSYVHGYENLLELCFMGNVMSYWLERRGVSALHASAVAVDGRAVGFLAGRNRGKSTAACSLIASGASLLADDILPVYLSELGVLAAPAFPQMKLSPQQLHYLGIVEQQFARVHPDYDKLLVPVFDGPGRYCDASVPLSALYVLDRHKSGLGPPRITDMSPAEAMKELLRHSFAAELVDAVDRGTPRISRLATIARSVKVRRLEVPTGYDRLHEVAALVKEDIAEEKEMTP